MGLAASQARLLTITARKSDCEYKSMAYSHQKIALSRDMNAISSEYEAALEQTKLAYDFYGSGDTTTPLSYGLLMSPSVLNDYMPSPITDKSGRIVLNAALASAAEAAGIPQEGLGCTPSSDVRNMFVQGLVDAGIITSTVGSGIQAVTYNPNAGLGSSEMITTTTKTVTFSEFIDQYLAYAEYNFADLTTKTDYADFKIFDVANNVKIIENGNVVQDKNNPVTVDDTVFSLKDLINGDYVLYGKTKDIEDMHEEDSFGEIIDIVGSCDFWDNMFQVLGSVLPSDSYTQAALAYAQEQTLRKVECLGIGEWGKDDGNGQCDISNAAAIDYKKKTGEDKILKMLEENSDKYVGYYYVDNTGGGYNCGYGLDLSSMTKAFFTYFAQYMDGLATTEYKVTNEKDSSNFVTDNGNAAEFSFEVVDEVDTTGDNLMVANFYDTLFNQIATNGWVKNDKVDDNDYLQTMLKSGAMYISTIDEDDYYYQNNYATNTYIKEVTDEEGIAIAEAKYNREKSKITYKENILDMKMKNLDTEISSLNTEYETVKSVISKNVSKSFKRYSA